MRTYEALYIVSPEVDDDGIQTVTQEVESLITKQNGNIVRSEIWGKRKLAYTVQKHTEGQYVLMRFECEPEFISRLESHFKLAENVIRDLVVHLDAHTLRLEAEQQRRKEEDLRPGGPPGGRSRSDDDDDEDDIRPRRRPAYGEDRRPMPATRDDED